MLDIRVAGRCLARLAYVLLDERSLAPSLQVDSDGIIHYWTIGRLEISPLMDAQWLGQNWDGFRWPIAAHLDVDVSSPGRHCFRGSKTFSLEQGSLQWTRKRTAGPTGLSLVFLIWQLLGIIVLQRKNLLLRNMFQGCVGIFSQTYNG